MADVSFALPQQLNHNRAGAAPALLPAGRQPPKVPAGREEGL
jgi:hypothetical protein